MDFRYKRGLRITSGFSVFLLCSLLFAACSSGQSSTSTSSATSTASAPATSTSGASPNGKAEIAWPAFDGGGSRSGVNTSEKIITSGNVGHLTRLWQQTLPAVVDSSPVELPGVKTPAGVKTLLFVTTLAGSLLALDANSGQQVWRQNTSGPKFTTSSPALDPSGQYVYSYGLDGKIHKYAVGSGAEQTGGGWPVRITNMPDVEKGSSSLNVASGYLYMSTSGYPGDAGHYQGHVVAISLTTGALSVFNSLCANIHRLLDTVSTDANYCPDVQSGIWARAGAVVDPLTGNVFVTTGNGNYTADKGGYDYGDSIIELSPNLQKVVDSYTPSNYSYLQSTDLDLGSAAPTMLPMQKGSLTPYLAVQVGKDSAVRLLNRQNLSGKGGPNHVGGELQTLNGAMQGSILTQPVAWNDAHNTTWVFITNGGELVAFKVITDAHGHTTLQKAYQNSHGGSSPFIANNILFVQGNNVLWAMEPATGKVLWSSTQSSAGGSIGGLHWQSPIIVNGRVYVADEAGHLTAYGLK
ncbi:MAG TPA: PQQ-binding-like beta-propeller repeat protein [Ktedonobacteraceae bacterium]|nr:PQQ-binding-like beta-propeller repeat protein [Ktedonobacteraceae bacterium]